MLAGREPAEEDMEPLSWWVWRRARALDAVSANLAAVRMQTLARAVVTWAQPYDAILCPTLAEAPVPRRTIDPFGPEPSATFARGAAFTPFTAISNVTGSPAISLPLAVHPAASRSASSSSDGPPGRGRCSRSPHSWRPPGRGPTGAYNSGFTNETGVENRPWPT